MDKLNNLHLIDINLHHNNPLSKITIININKKNASNQLNKITCLHLGNNQMRNKCKLQLQMDRKEVNYMRFKQKKEDNQMKIYLKLHNKMIQFIINIYRISYK